MLRRGSLRALQCLRDSRQAAALLQAQSFDQPAQSPHPGPVQAWTSGAGQCLTFRSGFATSPHHLQGEQLDGGDDGALPSTSGGLDDTSPAQQAAAEPAAALAQSAGAAVTCKAALGCSSLRCSALLGAGEPTVSGFDPASILDAVSHAEQDALLVAWQDSGWNIFNSGFQTLLTTAQEYTGLPW